MEDGTVMVTDITTMIVKKVDTLNLIGYKLYRRRDENKKYK